MSIDAFAHTVRSISAKSGKVKATTQITSAPRDIALSPDAKVLAVTSSDGTQIINTANFSRTTGLDDGSSYAAAFSPDGKHLATGTYEIGTVYLFAYPTYAPVAKEEHKHKGSCVSLSFSPRSDKLVSASRDSTAILWSVPDMCPISTLAGHVDSVNCAVFISDFVVATAGWDHSVRFWSTETGYLQHTIEAHADSITHLALSPDLTKLATSANDSVVKIFDTNTYECIRSFPCSASARTTCFVNDTTLLIGRYYHSLYCINIGTGVETVLRKAPKIQDPTGLIVLKETC